ncbi:hypothetical protein Pcinc_038395 [Petrolisthes cinctipes]|uniref:Uncharacterized protein n=1 Tax=Petrolisthes cinctipes TaxID=88211 RepID=A0AAE1BRY0_PETCI|nr:hypothetical protein Pcinc_038395 [Petrolisthes cinctipes]
MGKIFIFHLTSSFLSISFIVSSFLLPPSLTYLSHSPDGRIDDRRDSSRPTQEGRKVTHGTLQSEGSDVRNTPLRRPIKHSTHQTDEDTDELNDIGVGHSVEAAEEGVEDGDAGREDDGDGVVQVEYHTEGRS